MRTFNECEFVRIASQVCLTCSIVVPNRPVLHSCHQFKQSSSASKQTDMANKRIDICKRSTATNTRSFPFKHSRIPFQIPSASVAVFGAEDVRASQQPAQVEHKLLLASADSACGRCEPAGLRHRPGGFRGAAGAAARHHQSQLSLSSREPHHTNRLPQPVQLAASGGRYAAAAVKLAASRAERRANQPQKEQSRGDRDFALQLAAAAPTAAAESGCG